MCVGSFTPYVGVFCTLNHLQQRNENGGKWIGLLCLMGSSKGQSLLCIVRARTGMKKIYSIKAKRGKFIADKAIELLLFICFDC